MGALRKPGSRRQHYESSTFRRRCCRDSARDRAGIGAGQLPSRAITIINAFPPGGLNDIVTRPLAAALEPILKQPVVIDTKAGAAGQVGAQVAATAKPNGYTLLSHNVGISGYAEVEGYSAVPSKSRAPIRPSRAPDRRAGLAPGQ